MKLTPAARTATQTCPGAGAPGFASSTSSTSGPPCLRTTMARDMDGRVASAGVFRFARRFGACCLFAAALMADPARADEGATLTFRAADGKETVLSKGELRARCGAVTVSVEDPYYQAPRRFVACPLARVFELGLGAPPDAFAGEDFLLVALDASARRAPGRHLPGRGGLLALRDP